MERKHSKAPIVLGFIALSLSIVALICTFPIESFLKWMEYCLEPDYNHSSKFLSVIPSHIKCFLTSLILPVALLLISRENGRKKATVFLVISVFVILLQLVANGINLVIYEDYLNDLIIGNYLSLFTEKINGSFILIGLEALKDIIEEYSENLDYTGITIRIINYCTMILSSVFYILKNLLCTIGFITLLKKNDQ